MAGEVWRDLKPLLFSSRKGSDFRAKKMGECEEVPGSATVAQPSASNTAPLATMTDDLRFISLRIPCAVVKRDKKRDGHLAAPFGLLSAEVERF